MLDPILADYGIRATIPTSLRGQTAAKTKARWWWRKVFLWPDNLCSYCGEAVPRFQLTEDHVVPRSRGGANTLENIVQACHRCNGEKDDKSLLMFLWERAA